MASGAVPFKLYGNTIRLLLDGGIAAAAAASLVEQPDVLQARVTSHSAWERSPSADTDTRIPPATLKVIPRGGRCAEDVITWLEHQLRETMGDDSLQLVEAAA